MKIIISLLSLIFVTITLYANENWIKIEPMNGTKKVEKKAKIDVDVSKVKPINKMLKNITIIKQLLDATSKKEKPTTNNEKNWFVLNKE